MRNWTNPNINPPVETTPEEADSYKRTMGKKKGAQDRKSSDDTLEPTAPVAAGNPTA